MTSAWSENGSDVPDLASLEGALAIGVALYYRITQQRARFAGKAREGTLSPSDCDELAELRRQWQAAASPLLAALQQAEAAGQLPGKSAEFRECARMMEVMDLDYDRISASLTAALEGRARPLREAADDFCRIRYSD